MPYGRIQDALDKHLEQFLITKIRLDDDGQLLDEERRRITASVLSCMSAQGYVLRAGWSLDVRLLRDARWVMRVLTLDPMGGRHDALALEAWESLLLDHVRKTLELPGFDGVGVVRGKT